MAVDLLDPPPAVRIISVTSNEPVEAPEDDGHTAPDWEITGGADPQLRAERSGAGTGRLYTIAAEATDAAGNTKVATVDVRVPLER